MRTPPAIVTVGRWTPFDSGSTYRQPLVADTLEALRSLGARSIFASPRLPGDARTDVELVALPAWMGASPRTAGFLRRVALARPESHEPWWRTLREAAPELIVALNPDALPLAGVLARWLGARVVLFNLGGVTLPMALRSWKAFGDVVLDSYLPLFLRVDALINVEDTTGLHLSTPVARLPVARRLHLPIPHRQWPARTRAEAERAAGLSPSERARVVWAGRFDALKRPEVFIELARAALRRPGASVEFVMVGAPSDAARARVAADPVLARGLTLRGLADSETLPAILQAADVVVFTSALSVAGTILRETAAAGVPVACTIDPRDLLLFTLLDPTRDVLPIEDRDPDAAATTLLRALADPAGLRAMAARASARVRDAGLSVAAFADAAARFLLALG